MLLKKEHNILTLRKEQKKLLKDLSQVSKELDFIRTNYNTSLFESIENNTSLQNKQNTINTDIKQKYNIYTKKLET